MAPSFQELECAACDVIQIIKQIPELEHTRLSVIGGLALWHYLPNYRPTDNINFITNISTSPSGMKKRLLERPGSPFVQRSQVLFYQTPGGQHMQIDISPEWLSPYLPASAKNVRDIRPGEVPYISLRDLAVFKLDSSGLRSSLVKKERDARDAAALVEHAIVQQQQSQQPDYCDRTPLALTKKQEQVVEEALCDVSSKCGAREKGWWQKHLGLWTAPNADSARTTLHADNDDNNSESQAQSQRARSRPHANSDSTYAGIYRTDVAGDPGAAWYYERLDRAHVRAFRRFNSVGSNGSGGGLGQGQSRGQGGGGAPRPGVARSSTYAGCESPVQQQGQQQRCFMTQPKTSNASYWGFGGGSGGVVGAAVGGMAGPRAKRSSTSCSADSGYEGSDCDGHYYYLEPPGGGLDTVKEHADADAGGGGPGRLGPVKRSVTFQL
ncbi:Uu.00g102810.m01.CDS01 [Anthostomella pinea]|uniref:Uu.00g102810.m01.CDS01 n=1 Tax=Anthostomella pinea TaxID=933095 RepID=A0AAI8VEE7_9PEZI|nr:Uu.00g102810.m01.CDS01 [Anthostomella pinea]